MFSEGSGRLAHSPRQSRGSRGSGSCGWACEHGRRSHRVHVELPLNASWSRQIRGLSRSWSPGPPIRTGMMPCRDVMGADQKARSRRMIASCSTNSIDSLRVFCGRMFHVEHEQVGRLGSARSSLFRSLPRPWFTRGEVAQRAIVSRETSLWFCHPSAPTGGRPLSLAWV